MKTIIITNAGVSSRFNKGSSDVRLKAIYYREDPRETLLYHMLQKCVFADRIILVGGFLYEDLQQYVSRVLPAEIRARITLVYNAKYEELGSGYSFYLGIRQALEPLDQDNEILFVEGDLDLDGKTFQAIAACDKNVLSCNQTAIYSNKAVVLYQVADGRYRYAFNSAHGLLEVTEPFSGIFNSGQMWKFKDPVLLKKAAEEFRENEIEGTNLRIIQRYLDEVDPSTVELITFKRWVNCNTREDFAQIDAGWTKNVEWSGGI